jgi:hypothetical protein
MVRARNTPTATAARDACRTTIRDVGSNLNAGPVPALVSTGAGITLEIEAA